MGQLPSPQGLSRACRRELLLRCGSRKLKSVFQAPVSEVDFGFYHAGRGESTSSKESRKLDTNLGREIRLLFGQSRLRLRGGIGGEARRASVSRSLRRALQLDAGSTRHRRARDDNELGCNSC